MSIIKMSQNVDTPAAIWIVNFSCHHAISLPCPAYALVWTERPSISIFRNYGIDFLFRIRDNCGGQIGPDMLVSNCLELKWPASIFEELWAKNLRWNSRNLQQRQSGRQNGGSERKTGHLFVTGTSTDGHVFYAHFESALMILVCQGGSTLPA